MLVLESDFLGTARMGENDIPRDVVKEFPHAKTSRVDQSHRGCADVDF